MAIAFAVISVGAPIPRAMRQQVGAVHFSTSCTTAVQPRFDRSVALLHSFAFAPATDAFNQVLRTDPHCAMAWWGIALSAWGNPFAAGAKPPAQIARGLAAVREARAAGPRTEREAAYIDAAARLYEHADSMAQPDRLAAYRDAMANVVLKAPTDTEAVIFQALAAVFSADPKDKTYSKQLAAGATLERLVARMPDHPGLTHYIIHAYDVPSLASRALTAANRYSRIAPAISHALHMPSHTFTRAGYWQQSIDANVAAAAAARRERSTAEELHATDYRTYAYLQMGRGREAAAMVRSVAEIVGRFDPSAAGTGASPASGYYAIAAIPARYALERGAWAEAAALSTPSGPITYANAVTWFARGIGASRSEQTALTDSAVAALAQIRDGLLATRELYWSEQVEIERASVAAWRMFMSGERTNAIAAMRSAAAREDATEKNAVMPGPIVPAHELLGEMLLESNEPALALAAFAETLTREPGRFRATAKAAIAAARAGDHAAAKAHSAALLKLGAHAGRPPRA